MNECELGKKSSQQTHYNPEILFPIPRIAKRQEIQLDPQKLPFYGFDCWNHYEVSWLNENKKPQVAIAEIIYDCHTPNIIESKSLKLYFNSLNNAVFKNKELLTETIIKDLEKNLQGNVSINICSVEEKKFSTIESFPGFCLDNLDIVCEDFTVNPKLLSTQARDVKEKIHSHLLRSNCLITHQPDWGSVYIEYEGKQISHESLLAYLVSFRNHNEFHEQCIERIFADIMKYCQPKHLTVYGRYTRRGGLDINPYRSTRATSWENKNWRLSRQ